MKQFLLTSVFALMAFVGIRAQKPVVWEKPVIGYSQYNYIEIQKVELAKDRTSLHMQITYPSDAWFQFSPQTYLEVDGKQYPITGGDSIQLGVHTYTSPKTMRKEFVLHFKPIPQKTKVFDMLESTRKGDFTFFYIHPSDYKMPEAPVPADFRADYPEDDVWPEKVFSEEPAVVHFKALNYKKGMDVRIDANYFDITNPNDHNESHFNLDDEGCADFICKVYYPTHLQFDIPSAEGVSGVIPQVAPGKEVTILLDMLRDDKYPNTKVIGYKGYMAKFDKEQEAFIRKYIFNKDDHTLPDYPTESIEQFKTVDELIALHDSLIPAFDKATAGIKDFSDVVKNHYLDWELRLFSLYSDDCPSLFNTQEFRDYIFRTRPRCFFTNRLPIDYDLRDVMKLFAGSDVKGAGPDLLRFVNAMSELNSGIINPKPLIDDPNLSRLYDQKRQELTAKISQQKEGLAKNVHYLELAEVAPEQTLQFFLDRYKGKTVMIDMWATWCVPCIQGQKAMEPVKQELKDKDIVYLNLTYSTSPFDKWKEAVKTISGEHYYLSPQQFEALSHLYQSGGAVPTYAIYNPKGELVYKCVGFGGVEPLKEGLMKALK